MGEINGFVSRGSSQTPLHTVVYRLTNPPIVDHLIDVKLSRDFSSWYARRLVCLTQLQYFSLLTIYQGDAELLRHICPLGTDGVESTEECYK